MKKTGLIVLMVVISASLSAQRHSDLYKKIVKVMETDLNFIYKANSDSEKPVQNFIINDDKKGIKCLTKTSVSSSSPPLVLLDNVAIKMSDLNGYPLKVIKSIEVIQPDDPVSTLYGQRGLKGVILISRKH